MGLDITAYSRLRKIEHNVSDEERETLGLFRPLDNPNFLGRATGLEPKAHYVGQDQLSFRAGAYSHYNQWRDWLARVAGYDSAEDVWAKNLQTGPFVELINFADNEGSIGPVVAKKLYADFIAFDDKAKAACTGWEYERYRRWRAAFELAADDGAVDFH